MHILADLEPDFKKYLLKPLDIEDGLIIGIIALTQSLLKL